MAVAKPSSSPIWATSAAGGDITTPTSPKQAQGWVVEKPPHQYFNWWQNLMYQWQSYFADRDNLQSLAGLHASLATMPATINSACAVGYQAGGSGAVSALVAVGNGIIYSGPYFGSAGLISRTIGGSGSANYKDVASDGAGTLLAAGAGGSDVNYASSVDGGVTWSGYATAQASLPLRVIYAASLATPLWVVVCGVGGGSNHGLNTSATGLTGSWTSHTGPATSGADISGIAQGNGLVAMWEDASTHYFTSVDGISFTARTLPAATGTGARNAIQYNVALGLWILGAAGGKVYTSSDCINWTLRFTHAYTASPMNIVCHGKLCIAIAPSGTALGATAYSFNAVDWVASNLSLSGTSAPTNFNQLVALPNDSLLLLASGGTVSFISSIAMAAK